MSRPKLKGPNDYPSLAFRFPHEDAKKLVEDMINQTVDYYNSLVNPGEKLYTKCEVLQILLAEGFKKVGPK